MALEITDLFITSDVTPEFACHVRTDAGDAWFLSWLPDTPLTRDEAVNGMVLDETLSDPALADVATAMEIAAHRADALGTNLVDVIIRLSTRILERDPIPSSDARTPDAAPTPPGVHPGRSSSGGERNCAPDVMTPRPSESCWSHSRAAHPS